MAEPRFRHVLPKITERQWQVAELVALGYSNNEIADDLGITVAGAKYHVSELLRRLEVTRRDKIARWYRSERVVRGQVIDPSNFDPEPIPAPLLAQAAALGWPDALLDRARELRVSVQDLGRWLRYGGWAEFVRPSTAEEFERWLGDRELLMYGTLRSRVASFGDNEALTTLYAHSTEPSGDSDLIVERGPHAFAQFRLIEESHVQILEDRGIALAAVARGYPVVRIDGKDRRIETQLAFVVRDGARGHRYSRLISHVGRPADAHPVGSKVFYFMRPENEHGHGWVSAKGRTSATKAPDQGLAIPGFPATVHYVTGEPPPRSASAIRSAEPRDLEACARLITDQHGDAPLFLPTSAERLATRLDRGGASVREYDWPAIYGWGDLYVAERHGRIVACAGWWDAGRNVREVWIHRRSGRRTVIEDAALLDCGYEPGADDCFVELVHHAMRLTSESGRNRLAVWLDRDPPMLARLEECYTVRAETRALQCSLEDGEPPAALDRPFVDLAYW